MTADEQLYVNAASRHGAETLEGDAAAVNKAYSELVRALSALRESPDKGVEFLSGLLSSEDLSVVTWAALHLLPFKGADAEVALERVSRSGLRLISFGAEVTLREWRAGRLKVD